MAKMKGSNQIGGALTFIGALVYLYVYFAWYSGGYGLGPWVSAAQFLGPLVIAAALFCAVSLFFMSIGSLMGMNPPDPDMKHKLMWNFTMWGAITFVILTGGTGFYWWALLGFLLTYIGAMKSSM